MEEWIDDAPALAQTILGMAVGTAGADGSVEAADVALKADDLTKISGSLRVGKKGKRNKHSGHLLFAGIAGCHHPSSSRLSHALERAAIHHEGSETLAVANGLCVWHNAWDKTSTSGVNESALFPSIPVPTHRHLDSQ